MRKDDNRLHQFNLWYAALAILALFALRDFLSMPDGVRQIPYSEFQRLVQEGRVSGLVIGETRISGSVRDPAAGEPRRFVTQRVDPELADRLAASGVEFAGEPEPGLLMRAIGWVLPMALLLMLWLFLLQRFSGGIGGGVLSIGKSRARIYAETDIPVRFSDVAGVDEAKAELQEIVAFLKDPEGYGRLGARMPKGVLLVGPPGTGKTLLARAVAGEAGVPFFSISGSEFVEMFVGVGAARVRDLFEQAQARAPCIVFIDELDALGRARGAFGNLGGHDEKEQTLNQLLTEMDGFDPRAGVVLLGATNRPEILDPALLRAGRFDRQVLVDRPDRKGRADILAVHLKKIRHAPDLDREAIAALTPGFTGADLANLVNEAALLATRRSAEQVEMRDIEAAIERIVAGLEKRNRLLNPREREIVAHHEMGHAIVAMALKGADPVQKVSIIPRGIGALGYTIQRPTEDRFLMGRQELKDRMAVLLAGRAAERLIFGEISTGAADDLAKATDIARSMVMRFGMGGEDLGEVAYEPERPNFLGTPEFRPRQYAEATAARIDAAVKALIAEAAARAEAILAANRPLLERSARELLERETLDEAALKRLRAEVLPEAAAAAA
jgi:cell division protease FtsH